ncbi:hypothetical protein [Streptomyces sp. NPDC005476]
MTGRAVRWAVSRMIGRLTRRAVCPMTWQVISRVISRAVRLVPA